MRTESFDPAAYLRAGREVDEEELFFAIVSGRIHLLRGAEAARAFQQRVRAAAREPGQSSSKEGTESAVYRVLEDFVRERTISETDRKSIITPAFSAAQLDTESKFLWDSVGGAGDETRAAAPRENALAALKNAFRGSVAGKASSGEKTSPSAEFLFKPVSNSSGTAAVLIPASLARGASSVSLSKDGKILESGRFTSFGEDGKRGKYVFKKAGSKYPSNLDVIIKLKNGRTITVSVPEPSKRTVSLHGS